MPYHDRKSTRLNSSHGSISYAVFCLKKKKNQINSPPRQPCRTTQPTRHTVSHLRRPSFCLACAPAPPRCAVCASFLFFFFFLMIRPPPRSPLFPSPTLFRSPFPAAEAGGEPGYPFLGVQGVVVNAKDRKSTRLNSSHGSISYAVFCFKQK